MDEELVARAQMGDREAFGLLFSRYENLVGSAATHWKNSLDDAFGLASECFVNAVLTYDEQRGVWFKSHARTVLFRHMHNEWTRLKAKKRSAHTLTYDAAFDDESLTLSEVIPDEHAWEQFDRVTIGECLQEVIDRFVVSATERELEVFYMKIIQGLDNRNVADFFGNKVSAVESIDWKMKRKLRQYALDCGLLVELPKTNRGKNMKKKLVPVGN